MSTVAVDGKTTVVFDKADFLLITFVSVLLIGLAFYAGNEYASGKSCEAKGGKFFYSQCLKKDLFLE